MQKWRAHEANKKKNEKGRRDFRKVEKKNRKKFHKNILCLLYYTRQKY